MTIDRKYVDQIINVTSIAAIASSHLVGKKDKIKADQAAVDAMRSELNKIDMTGEIVIGEGSLDDAPMLYTGEILGKRQSGLPSFNIADLSYDGDLLEEAKLNAEMIINSDPKLENNKNLRDLLYIHERDTAIRTLNAG